MKTILVGLLLIAAPCFATFGNYSQWDVRTTGADTNGIAYDPKVAAPGTDESTGAGTAITVTLTGGTTGTCSPACTSTTHGPGNFIHIASGTGCTTGWFEILSISGSTITVDHGMGSNTNACVGVIGGPGLTIQNVLNIDIDGNCIWIKSGTYTITSALDASAGGNNRTSPCMIGYGTTHGDSGTRPLITTATNSTDILHTANVTSTNAFVMNIAFSNTAGTRGKGILLETNAFYIQVVGCTFTGFNRALDMSTNGGVNSLMFYNSSVINDQGAGIYIDHWTGATIVNSYLYNNAIGIEMTNGSGVNMVFVSGTIIASNTGRGIEIGVGGTQSRLIVVNSTIANNTSDGIGWNGSTSSLYLAQFTVQSNIIYGNGGFGLNIPTAGYLSNYQIGYNAWGANTSGNYTSAVAAGTGDVMLSATPFTNSGSQDFSLNSTAGGGTGCKSTGLPGTFPAGSTTGYHDIGAVTGVAAGSGGSPSACAFAYIPRMIEGVR